MKIVNVMASSLDGRIGLHDAEGDEERKAVGISGEVDQLFLREQIESCDAVLVGATSIRANGECLDHKGTLGHPPTWFIFCQKDLPEDLHFWSQMSIHRVLISPRPVRIVKGSMVENWVYGSEDAALFLYERLRESHYRNCLLFGGGVVNSWFYSQNLVDEICLTLAPIMLGRQNAPFLVAPVLPKTVRFDLITSHSSENFVFLRYAVKRF